ncbi:hypothetical protein SAMN06295967_11070 [Belliella buryatensis]|uniref:DUF4221 domain-containing protein n=1 Tax=Belliella buryatensis TaxID=1500549 RepID=A0A239ES62_9BACT|nr:hypothetical protein [Belliella buryatensis]SNS46873.1 hypothetical protein SAMN06295967_11070 [Belliella buryatensis]
MKHPLIIVLLALILLASCNSEQKGLQNDTDLSVAIVDFIQVAYMGNLFPYDFDAGSGLYLGRWNNNEEYVFFDDNGKIHNQFILQNDGPNTIKYAHGVGYMQGEFTILEDQSGITQIGNNGEVLRRIEIPKDFFFVYGLNFSAKEFEESYIYPRPERDVQTIRDMSLLFGSAYSSPILEVYNPKTNQVRNTMPFPKNSIYEDGNFYNHSFPNVIRNGKEWMLFLLAEMKYFVYKEQDGEVEFVKAVDLQLENAIPMPGVPMKDYAEWYSQKGHIIFGKIEQLYRRENDIIVIYTKGVDEEISKNYSPDNHTEWMDFIYNIPRYAAVFNQDHQLIKNDIPLPKGLIWSSVVNNDGDILALKNQDYFGVEEDFVTFYKLNILK